VNAEKYWMNELAAKSEGTRLKYLDYFNRFCEYLNKTPDELLAQRQRDLKADDVKQQRVVETALKSFLAHLKQTGNSPATQQVAYAAIRSFFEMHYLPLRMRRGDYPTGESLGSRAATKQVIRRILEDGKKMKDPQKVKALIMFLKDTGLRVSDVHNLTYGQVAEGLERNEQFIPISLVTQKYKTVAKTFIGPEAVEALKEYLEERRSGTRRITPETLTVDSPLFRTNENGVVKSISRSGLSSMLAFHCQRVGEVKLSAHSFRKYFQTQLEAAGVSPNWIDQMIGHRLINSRDSYSLPSDEQLREAYEKAYPQLRVYPEEVEVEERISKLEADIEERNRTIANLLVNGDQKESKITELERKMAGLEALLKRALPLVEQLEKAQEDKKSQKKTA
jgi:site-specific recombinase XerD